MSLGRWSNFVAFCIAAVKGALVVLSFMHILRTRSAIRLAAAIGVFIFGLLIAFSTGDLPTRDAPPLLSPSTVSKTGRPD